MSATDELRRLLDERGVEFATEDSAASKVTMWTTQNGGWMFDCDYMEPLNAKPGTIGAKTELMIYGYTPEQAIAATLGKLNATSNQESIVRSFLRKISPNRDWDYLGEHEHALIADLVDAIAATLGNPEIVRCRDCKHYTEDEAEYWHYCGEWCGQVEPDGFCAWGERRQP